jgi:predicted RNA binding protein YcfA (HicA-like mRNA interferase family)
MGKVPGVQHLHAVRALERAGFYILRQSKHIIMTDGIRVVTIPRNNPINAYTMFDIVRQAGLTIEQFRELL